MKRIIIIFLVILCTTSAKAQLNEPCLNIIRNDNLFGAGDGASWAMSDDFNGDSLDDIMVSYSNSANVVVYLNLGNGQFSDSSYTSSGGPRQFCKGDFNNDGHVDFLTANGKIFKGNANGTFNVSTAINNPGGNYASCAGDFNEDGNLDGVILGFWGLITVASGNGLGSFANPITLTNPYVNVQTTPTYQITSGDFNGDGHLDLISTASNIRFLYLGTGTGTFSNSINLSGGTQTMASGDYNSDGVSDLAYVNNAEFNLAFGDISGTFGGSYYNYPSGLIYRLFKQ